MNIKDEVLGMNTSSASFILCIFFAYMHEYVDFNRGFAIVAHMIVQNDIQIIVDFYA